MEASQPTVPGWPTQRVLLSVAGLLLATLGAVLWWTGAVERDPTVAAPAAATNAHLPEPAAGPASDRNQTEALIERAGAPLADRAPEEPQGVQGQLVDLLDRPVGGAKVYLVESLQSDPLARLRNVPTPTVAAATTDPDGRFRLGLRDARGQTFDLHVLATGFAPERVTGLGIRPDEWLDLGRIGLHTGCTIRGRVTIAGTALPVPQAVVVLERGDPLSDFGARDLPGYRRAQTATVDPAGFYELPHAPRAGIHRLVVVAPGFARAIRDSIELRADRPVEVDFELLPGLAIAGQILAEDGQPVAAARVEAWPNAAEPPHSTTSLADGRFVLHGLVEGRYRLRAAAEGFQSQELSEVVAGSAAVSLRLPRRAAVRVTVRSPQGTVLRHFRLALRRWFDSDGGQIAAVSDVPDRTVRLSAAEDEFLVDGLDPTGTYALQVEADGFARTLSAPFTTEPLPPLVEVTMTFGGTLQGQVLDQSGQPIAGARVSTEADGAVPDNPMWRMLASLTPDRITRATATTDSSGQFRLQRLAHANYQLEVEHPDYCSGRRLGLRIDRDAELALAPIVLQRGTLVRGRAWIDGKPQSQVLVVLTPVQESDIARKTGDESRVVRVEAVSGREGEFALPRRIPPGVYELRGALRTGTDPQVDIFRQLQQMQRSALTVTVAAGQEELEVDLRLLTEH